MDVELSNFRFFGGFLFLIKQVLDNGDVYRIRKQVILAVLIILLKMRLFSPSAIHVMFADTYHAYKYIVSTETYCLRNSGITFHVTHGERGALELLLVNCLPQQHHHLLLWLTNMT